jgi:hypothetical protein
VNMNSDVNEMVGKDPTTKSPVDTSELLNADAGNIDATTVLMERAGAEQVTADRVTMDRSGAQRINARSAQLDRSGALQLQSERAVLQSSSAWLVAAQEARLVKSRVIAVIAGHAEIDGETRSLLLIGPTSGNVKTVVTPAGAVGFGAGLGLILIIGRALARRLGGR